MADISIADIGPTTANAKALRAINKYGMNLADFAALTTGTSYSRIGNGGVYTVTNWISDGVFANLAAAQAVYPIIQSGSDQVDWVLLQSAIDFMIYGSLGSSVYGSTKRKLLIPAGRFRCNRPLQIGYATVGTPPANLNANGYVSITIEGEGVHYDPSGNGMTGTTLEFPYTNDVGIAVNKGVQILIKDLTVTGAYSYNNSLSVLDTAGVWDVANWKDPALPTANWLGGAAVNVGIALDPYTDSASAAAYPARVLPSYFGGGTTTAQFGTAGGSHCTLENVNISDFVIGYGRPHGDSNGEFIRHHVGNYRNVVYGIVAGHSQARNNSFRDLDFFNFHSAFSNEGGTRTNANLHGTYDNIHAAYGYQLLYNTAGGWSGPLVFTNIYMEGAYIIGTVSTQTKFENCYFSFYDQSGTRGSQTYQIAGSGYVEFDNCTFSAVNGLFVQQLTNSNSLVVSVNSDVTILNTTIDKTTEADAFNAYRYMGGIFSIPGVGRSVINGSLGTGVSEYFDRSTYRLEGNATLTHSSQEYRDYEPRRAYSRSGTPDAAPELLGGHYRFEVPKITYKQVNLTTCSARSGFDVTFPRYVFGTLKADVGDIFYVGGSGSETTICVVVSISGGNMVLRQINNYFGSAVDDYQTNGKTQITAGNSYFGIYICTRIRSNAGLILGTATAGSNIITNVKHALDNANAVNTDQLTMAVGDLFIHQEPSMLNAGGSPVSPLNPITGINTGAQTITLTNNFRTANAHYPVVFYVKVFNA